jgi:hypothetical protein
MFGNRLVSIIANDSMLRCSPNLVLKNLPVSPIYKAMPDLLHEIIIVLLSTNFAVKTELHWFYNCKIL